MSRSEHDILVDHMGPEAFENIESRQVSFNNVRRIDLIAICGMYELPVDPSLPKLIGEGDRVTGIIPRMRNWLAEGRFDKVVKGQGGRPKSVGQYRAQQAAERMKESAKETEAA